MMSAKPVVTSGISGRTMSLKCNYDDCEEKFDDHQARLKHSMDKHTDLNSKKYPTLIGADDGLMF